MSVIRDARAIILSCDFHWIVAKSIFSMIRLTAKFEGGPIDQRAQTKVGWFSTYLGIGAR